MQGKQDYQPLLFSTLNLENFVPDTHLLRKYEQVLDLRFIHQKTEKFYCAGNGRPSVDPEVFMRMMLLSHIYGIHSDRQLCEEIHCNLAYRWFCKFKIEDAIPDHSSLTRIRDRLGKVTFKELFELIIKQCAKKGLVSGKRVIADGALIDADASLYSLVKMGEEGKAENSNHTRRKTKWILGEKISNKTHRSVTDPDSRLAGKMGNKMMPRFKDHRIIDADSRVILDTHITDGGIMEGKIFTKRLQKTEKNLGISVEETIADRGYGYGENLKELIEKKREVFIPTFHKDVGDNIEGFEYDEKKNEFICLAGKRLKAQKSSHGVSRYRADKNACVDCPFGEACKAIQLKNRSFRTIVASDYHVYQGMIRRREKTDEFKSRMRERMWKVEGLFAEAKENHGLRRAKYRGRVKMQIQAYLVASVQNLKRMMGAGSSGFELIFDLLNWTKVENFLKINPE